MDGRRRIAESLNDGFAHVRRRAADYLIGAQRILRRWLKPLFGLQLPRGLGAAATALFFLASAGYGVVCGDLGPAIVVELRDARDATANALGFRITSVSLAGQAQVTPAEALSAIGINGHSSLLFLDAASARAQLKTN